MTLQLRGVGVWVPGLVGGEVYCPLFGREFEEKRLNPYRFVVGFLSKRPLLIEVRLDLYIT